MRSNRTRRTIRPILAAALVVVVAACGDDGGGGGGGGETAAADPSESAYCDAAIEWAIHELTPVDDTDPAAFRAYWEDYRRSRRRRSTQRPTRSRPTGSSRSRPRTTTVTPVLEKYDFDVAAMMESGTPEEQAAFEAPPDVQAAQDRILAYESEVCGAQQPLAADVSYASEEPGPYCELVAAQDERAGEALASGDPAEVEAVFDALEEASRGAHRGGPGGRSRTTSSTWRRGPTVPQRDVAERHGYDFRAAHARGHARRTDYDLNYADEEIREQFARVLAYEEQVCVWLT